MRVLLKKKVFIGYFSYLDGIIIQCNGKRENDSMQPYSPIVNNWSVTLNRRHEIIYR